VLLDSLSPRAFASYGSGFAPVQLSDYRRPA
jgi:hypothetical protein